MKVWITACCVAALSGCGTIKTLNDEKGAADDLASGHSNCHSIPRAYSGVAYNYCVLDGPEKYGVHSSAEAIVIDVLLSSVTDTVLLPYTLYQQGERGSIQVRRKQ
nr:YceK/YidQ family lipoprotein [uncultured Pseudomonas sp.]